MNEFENSTTKSNDRELFQSESRIADLTDSEQALQSRIDQALVNRFSMLEAAMPSELVDKLEARQTELRSSIFNRRAMALVAIASFLAVVIFGVWQLAISDRSPFFQVKPLASIYNECLERGFKPTHQWQDVEQVEETFLFEHGVELKLTKLPSNKKLLGISHLGGVSRNTFAVLFETDSWPVVVFIDKVRNHDPAAVELPEISELNVYTQVCGKFVLYEVSPNAEPMFLDHLALPDQ